MFHCLTFCCLDVGRFVFSVKLLMVLWFDLLFGLLAAVEFNSDGLLLCFAIVCLI